MYDMTIAGLREKCKSAVKGAPRDVLIVSILVLASSAAFGLGFLAGRDAGQGSPVEAVVATSTCGQFMASKGGTKYYLPGCPGADRITDANKIWFSTPAAALAAGYSPAANCKGL